MASSSNATGLKRCCSSPRAVLAVTRVTVYVGIDVFAPETKHLGGNEAVKAVEIARKHGSSSAILAASYVYETQDEKELAANQCRFWNSPECCCAKWRVRTLPLRTSFCQGFGKKLFEAGNVRR
ncbi:hypothetical protein V5799_010711 [Amblyomma americanum]|uniref:Cytosolic endo-beta-N-acetylglucosaminidase TIM barrel domain-containing protein n=1 Tax=Amblyomma americanum TaxID=6943 RepID=A0AAQ4EJ43_AMBAM